jgi:hypothetical protein
MIRDGQEISFTPKCPNRHNVEHMLQLMGTRIPSHGQIGLELRLTTLLHLVSRLRIGGDIPTLLPYAFLSQRGPSLPLLFVARERIVCVNDGHG